MNDLNQGWLSPEEVIFHRMECFHRDRVGLIEANQPPFPLKDEGRLIVHMIPAQSVESRIRFPATDLKKHGQHILPLSGQRSYSRINPDGFFSHDGEKEVRSYTQLFWNGRLESLTTGIAYQQQDGVVILREVGCEDAVINIVVAAVRFYKDIGIKAPIYLFSALTRCKGVRFRDGWGFPNGHVIDRSPVFLPEIEIAGWDVEPAKCLRPLCDALWNAAGFEQSQNYDEEGNRKPRS